MASAVLDRVFAPAQEDDLRARQFNEQISENYSRLLRGEATPTASARTATPVMERTYEPTPAPSAASRRMSQYVAYEAPASAPKLFENYSYKNGVLVDVTKNAEPATPTAAPVARVMEAPAYAPSAEEENEDARPTTRTMETLHRKDEASATQTYSIASELTSKAKALLAAVAFVIVVAIAVICINTSVLSTLDAELGTMQTASNQLSARYESIQQDIEQVTSEQNVAEWAQANGMVLSK